MNYQETETKQRTETFNQPKFMKDLSSYRVSMKYQSVALLISIGLIACLAIGVSTAQAQMSTRQYNVTDLGVLPAKKARVSIPAAINEQGLVTGTSGMSYVDESAFLYDPKRNKEAMEDLGRNAAGISRGFAINGVGDVVGDSTFDTSEAMSHAALFRNGKIADLGILKGGVYSRATGINASGLVVGFSGLKPDESSMSRAFLWSASTGMLDIGTLGGEYAQAFGINDSAFVTGTAQIAVSSRVPITHAFIYQPFSMGIRKNMIDLGTLGGKDSYGMAINANNHVAGYSTLNGGLDRVHAFLHDGRKMRDLGSLDGRIAENDQSYALGVNIIDQVVGYSYVPTREGPVRQAAFLYSQGVMMDLNGLLGPDAAKQYWLHTATAINNNGQIVAIAEDLRTNEIHAVLLTQ